MSDEKSGVQPSVQPEANQAVEAKSVADAVAKVLGISGVAAWTPANPLAHAQSGVKYGQERQRNASVVRQV